MGSRLSLLSFRSRTRPIKLISCGRARPIRADGLNTKDPASVLAYCQSLRTFTSEALPLSTTDGALMRWAFLKYKGAFDSIVTAGGQGGDECFSSDDANLVKLMFPWTGVAPTQVAQQAAAH